MFGSVGAAPPVNVGYPVGAVVTDAAPTAPTEEAADARELDSTGLGVETETDAVGDGLPLLLPGDGEGDAPPADDGEPAAMESGTLDESVVVGTGDGSEFDVTACGRACASPTRAVSRVSRIVPAESLPAQEQLPRVDSSVEAFICSRLFA